MKKFNNNLLIGITGGIATGKTTVTDYLSHKYHFPIVDADILAREAVQINSPIYQEIITRYSDKIITLSGELNREKLGEIVFNNPQEKEWLESQIHPFVRSEIELKINSFSSSIIILSIPLLFEAKMTDLTSAIWVVSCRLSQQLKRLQTRNNFDQRRALVRINSQIPLSEKIKQADVVLDNNGTLEQLYQQIDREILTLRNNCRKFVKIMS